jgi:hypothetical protein
MDGIDNKYIKYLKNMNNLNNNEGFLFNNNYTNELYYKNKYCKFLKSVDKDISYYFQKKYTTNQSSWCWCGLYMNDYDENGKEEYVDVSFNIKILKKLYKINDTWGLKTHYPLNYYNDWIDKCILNEFVNINLKININRISQYIIFNFDNYNNEVEFIIKNFKIILGYK